MEINAVRRSSSTKKASVVKTLAKSKTSSD